MPIVNYSKPQSFVQQYLQVLTDAVAASRNAFIYGPQYRLSRYTNTAEKLDKDAAFTAGTAEDVKAPATGDFKLTSATLGADETFDADFAKVYAEDVEVALGSELGDVTTTGFYLKSLQEPHKIVWNENIDTTAAPADVPTVEGRAIKVGDYLEISDEGDLSTYTRKVVGFEQSNGADSVIVLDGAATLRHVTATWSTAQDEVLTAQVVIKYTGEIEDTYYSDVTNGVTFGSLPSVFIAETDSDYYAIRSGEGRLYLHYRALVQPGANENIKKIKSPDDIETYFGSIDPDNFLAYGLSRALSGSAGKEVYGARIREDSLTGYNEVLKKASQNINLYAHAPLTYDLTIQQAVATHVKAMSTWDTKRWRRAYVASDVPDGYVILDEEDDGTDYQATIDTDSRVLTVTQGDVDFVDEGVSAEDVVRLANVEITTVKAVADDADSLDGTYFTLADAAGTVGVWFDVDDSGTAAPGGATASTRQVEVTGVTTDDSATAVATAIAAAFSGDSGLIATASGDTVTFTDRATGTRADAVAGDSGFLVLTKHDGTDTIAAGYTEYVIEKVLGPVTLLLKTTPAVDYSDETFEVWAGNTGTKQAEYAANRSNQLGNLRVINIFCDNGTRINSDGETEVVENIFLAAEIAGLRSVALPHQGLTRTEVTTVSDAPLMYTKYTEEDLNLAAAAGVFIITQDLEDGPVYIRHQLTTQTDKGSLYYEDSVGTNLDDISFNVVSVIDGYIGKYNATPDTVLEIQNKINELLHNKARADRTQFFIGPQLLDYDPSDLTVEIDDTLRDQINVSATLTLPLPLNKIIVELFAGVSFNN